MTIFTPPDPATPAPTPPDLIQGDAFFPSIDPAAFNQVMRLVSQVSPPRTRQALLEAMIQVEGDLSLSALKAGWTADGHATLEDVPADQFGGEHRLVFLYRRAVYSFAKAQLDEQYRDNAMTGSGEQRAEGVDVTVGSHLRNARNALSDLTGRRRSTVELL